MIAGKISNAAKKISCNGGFTFVSVVLFISASSFCAYISKSINSVVDRVDYDIAYSFSPDDKEKYTLEELFKELTEISGVTDNAYMYSFGEKYVEIPIVYINKEYVDYCKKYMVNIMTVLKVILFCLMPCCVLLTMTHMKIF